MIKYLNFKLLAFSICFILFGFSLCYSYEIAIPGIGMPKMFTTSDIDLDGDQDLIVSGNTLSGNFKILKNLGNGTFNIENSLPGCRRNARNSKLYDFNNDGYPDIDCYYPVFYDDGGYDF